MVRINDPVEMTDPVYGSLTFDGVLGDIIWTPEFQRHWNVKQLGLAYRIFPGATHTRAAHMMGASQLMSRLIDERKMPVAEQFKLALKAAMLLHDIGQYDFSHASERAGNVPHHEENGKNIILGTGNIPRRKNGEINRLLKEYGIDPQFIVELLHKEKGHLPPFMYSLVSGKVIDCDRMDYLMRDTYCTGAKIGSIDLDKLVKTLTVHPETQELGIIESGVEAMEQMLEARMRMHRKVYFHPITDVAETMLIRAIESSKDAAFPMMYGDEALLERILDKGTPLSQDLIQRLNEGKNSFYKPAYTKHASDENIKLPESARSFEQELQKYTGLADGDILVSMPGAHRKPKQLPSFPVFMHDSKKWRDLFEISPDARTTVQTAPSNRVLAVYTKSEYKSQVRAAAEELLSR